MQNAPPSVFALVALALGTLPLNPAPAQDGGVEPEEISGRTASVCQYNGVPTLFVGGQPQSGMAFASYAAEERVFRDLAETGVDISSFVATPTGLAYHNYHDLDVWVSPDEFDYTPFDDRVGAPVGHYLAADLAQLDDQKLIILANCLAPSGEQRAAIEKLKGNGRWLVFHHAAGLYADGRLATEAMRSFTGVRVELDETPLPLQVTLDNLPARARHLHGLTFGSRRPITPVFVPNDPEVEEAQKNRPHPGQEECGPITSRPKSESYYNKSSSEHGFEKGALARIVTFSRSGGPNVFPLQCLGRMGYLSLHNMAKLGAVCKQYW